ncbi:unnamed protein product, partial [Closterium sp. NIES-53]
NLSSNSLSGSMPQSFARLTNLKELYLTSNSLTGNIPESIGNLTQLSILNLNGSGLTCPSDNAPCVAQQRLQSAFCRQCPSFCTTCIKPAPREPKTSAQIFLFQQLFSLQMFSFSFTATFKVLSLHYKTFLRVSPPCLHLLLSLPLPCPSPLFPSSAPPSPSPGSTTASPPPPTASPASPPPPSTSTSDSGGLSAAAIAGIAVAAVASLMVLLIGMLLCWRRYKKERETAQKSATADGGDDAVLQVKTDSEGLAGSVAASHCTEYSLEEVLTATSNWASDNQLRSGAFGDVYKGVSPRDGTTLWAVKRAKLLEADFQREVRQMAEKNHPNIVRLLGFSIGGDMRTRPEQVLIYEFVPNGDLKMWMSEKAPFPLILMQRLDILIGVARGLAYLHSFGLVHRDIKPANILLGTNMQANIADFGLVRMEEGTTVGTTRVMGTPGYVDPIYSQTSKATRSTDVYSFGVLMLVVLTGRSPFGTDGGENVHILKWVEECISSDNPASLNDLSMDAPDDAVLRLAQLALSCTVERTASRPNMAGMANELQKIRDEVVGKEEPVAAAKVDDRAQEIKGLTSEDAHLHCIDKILEGDSFGDHSSA